MKRKGQGLFVVSYLAPAVIIYGLFVGWPLVQSFMFSMYRWRGVSTHVTFVGFGNFKDLAGDDAFHKALTNNLLLLAVGGLITLVLSVAVAHGLQSDGKMSRTLRGIVLFPQILSLVIVAIMWMFIFNPQFGLFTSLLKAVGLGAYTKAWLGDPHTALPAVGIAFIWYAAGFYVMLFAAGLRGLPTEVGEAAQLDGAVGLRRFWNITWPMLWSVKRVVVVHLTITVMNVFVLVWIMTQGGPDRATEMLLTYLYENAFSDYQFGYATAIAVVNFAVVMLLSLVILFIFRRNPEAPRKVRA